ncbi:hypothetical protein BDV33DRAFT_172818 [Aspergillus novoparasiticus]|uniref:Uncharacterized protein n=1 Tax=Aspergillus novoparasiticus TaxID=986946 RepID=A0A5N6ER52_9EURO|nr:hypothetical protein BDV33DRAFT_172818 [Aspergillus novoparasiticus]
MRLWPTKGLALSWFRKRSLWHILGVGHGNLIDRDVFTHNWRSCMSHAVQITLQHACCGLITLLYPMISSSRFGTDNGTLCSILGA